MGYCRCAKSVYRANAYTYRDTAANCYAHTYRNGYTYANTVTHS